MKDYYQILELDVSATRQEIKKAYRRLAQQFHPDKNPNDAYATTRFSEIKEAYEVLTSPAKKEYYLEQRWFQKSMGKKNTNGSLTPVTILKQVLEFDRHLSKLDVHRMNKRGLHHYITTELLPDESIQRLNDFNDLAVNQEIVSLLLKNLFVIPVDQLPGFENRLSKILVNDQARIKTRLSFESIKKRNQQEQHKIWIILLVVIILSVLIYFAGQ